MNRLLAAVGGALMLGSSGCSGSPETSGEPAAAPVTGSSPYTVMQMNLCLSGFAGSLADGTGFY